MTQKIYHLGCFRVVDNGNGIFDAQDRIERESFSDCPGEKVFFAYLKWGRRPTCLLLPN